jgi:hypothetical protein
MNSDSMILDILGIAGSLLSLIGVVVAIWQVVKTRNAAEAATKAAREAHLSIRRNLLLSDVTSASVALEGMKALVKAERYEAALVRVTDLMGNLNQLKTLPIAEAAPLQFSEVLLELHVIRDLLERRTMNADVRVDPIKVFKALSQISDELNTWIGTVKYHLPES